MKCKECGLEVDNIGLGGIMDTCRYCIQVKVDWGKYDEREDRADQEYEAWKDRDES